MPARRFDKLAATAVHPYSWLWESLEAEASFILRSMFGSKAVYLDGRLQLCFMARREPWRGVLVCTDQQRQKLLVEEFPSLKIHPVLPNGFTFQKHQMISNRRPNDWSHWLVAVIHGLEWKAHARKRSLPGEGRNGHQ